MLIIRRLLSLLALSLVVTGCANYHTEKYFERNPEAIAASKAIAGNSERATVYLFRPRLIFQAISYTPVPPMYYAVDGKMISIMPLGSHVVLSLEPGRHSFTRIIVVRGLTFQMEAKRDDTTVEVGIGKTYYVGSSGFGSRTFGLVDSKAGIETVADSEFAKFIHQPVSVDAFLNKVASGEKKQPSAGSTQSSNAPARDGVTASIRDALPSAKQVGSFLEGLAAVALIGLVVVAAVAGSSSGNTTQYSPPNLPIVQPTVIQSSQVRAPTPARIWQNSSGTLSEIVQSKTEVIVNNLSSGVQYRIEDGRITGNDGSRYRVMGSNIFSATGQTYQVVGNNLFASDGSSCVMTGNIISCR